MTELEKKYMWQVRDTCRRAETAEERVADLSKRWRSAQQIAAAGLGVTQEGTDAWDFFADIHALAAQAQQAPGGPMNGRAA